MQPLHYYPMSHLETFTQPIPRRAGNTTGPNEDIQSQTLADRELSGNEDSHTSSDDKDQPGPSGLGRNTALASTAGSTATTPASADNTQLTPTLMNTAARDTANSTAIQSTQELINNTPVNEEGGSVLTVPPTTGPAREGRGGGRGRGDQRHQVAGAADDDHQNLSRVIDAYKGYQGEMAR